VSTKNTFTGLIPGVEITAAKVSAEPVSITIGENRDSVVEAAKAFVDSYNEIRTYIKENASYDVDTNEKGLLFTDQTVRQVERQLGSFVSNIFTGTGSSLRSLGEVGIKLDGEGKLSLDEDKFRSVASSKALDVEQLFTTTDIGVVAKFQKLTEALTSTAGGALTQRVDDITIQIDRQSTTLTAKLKLLTARESILRNQFLAMETALASFQSQQTALSQLTTIAAGFKASK
jgi:flagellar hook-associated protein 2